MRFRPDLLDEIRARLSVSQVVARKVQLKKKGREFAGLSPFKTEKTPSFFVNDQKGFYHCFASGEHGDIFTFLMKTEGLSFPEAVERLAEEAGVALPKPEPRDEQRADQRERLYQLLETAAKFFETALRSGAGKAARSYIDGRGLTTETISRFRLGYAPNSRTELQSHLKAAGFTAEELAVSGMVIHGPDIATPYDRFRNRVMFPIPDLKGRVIAFGGRALDPDQPAKYLNSPETPLFHKGRILFNAAGARPTAHDRQRIIAVEGYMDVVAMVQAGFGEAVAPLGTALTHEQLQLLWRMCPEPVLCFDGDTAGRKAAYRAVDTALPHLKPGMSLRFAFLPDGLDPDDLIRQSGPEALEFTLKRARPLAEVLFEREWAQGQWTTPERRARLEQQITLATARIENGTVRTHYERDMRTRLFEAWKRFGATPSRQNRFTSQLGTAPLRTGGRTRQSAGSHPTASTGRSGPLPPARDHKTPGGPAIHASASPSLRQSAMVAGEAAAAPYREALLLRTLLNHPWLIEAEAEEIARIELSSASLSRLRDALLSTLTDHYLLDRAHLRSQLTRLGVDAVVDLVERTITHRCDKFAEPDADADEVENGWRHALALHDRQSGLRRALDAAMRDFDADGSEQALARINEITSLLARSDDEHAAGASTAVDDQHNGRSGRVR